MNSSAVFNYFDIADDINDSVINLSQIQHISYSVTLFASLSKCSIVCCNQLNLNNNRPFNLNVEINIFSSYQK